MAFARDSGTITHLDRYIGFFLNNKYAEKGSEALQRAHLYVRRGRHLSACVVRGQELLSMKKKRERSKKIDVDNVLVLCMEMVFSVVLLLSISSLYARDPAEPAEDKMSRGKNFGSFT